MITRSLLFVAVVVLGCSGYRFHLPGTESGRFVYQGNTGDDLYCTVCKTGNNDEENKAQHPQCVSQNFRNPMPNNGAYPICKEGIKDSVIPGCGPLPTSRGLSWKTKSGRPFQKNSTVYEVYFPNCNLPGELNRKLKSVRCGENLTWDEDPSGMACHYGCGPLPTSRDLSWKTGSGISVQNSTVGEEYFPNCGQPAKMNRKLTSVRCGENLTWDVDPSGIACHYEKLNDDAEIHIWIFLYVLGSLVMIAVICVFAYCILIRKKCIGNTKDDQFSEAPTDPSASRPLITIKVTQPVVLEGCRTPVEQEDNTFKMVTEHILTDRPTSKNIRVFQALRVCENEKGISEFIVQRGEAVYIATNVSVTSPNYLQIRRESNTVYRGYDVYPFLHCIQSVESMDSGLYYWTTTGTGSCQDENVFSLKVTDRGQPDGDEISEPLLSKQNSCEERMHFLEYDSISSNQCLAVPSMASYNNVTNDEPVCKLTIDTICRDNSLEDFRKHLCNCLDSPTSCQARACWHAIAKTFLCRTDSFISSLEWHTGDTDDGPTSLILNDLREKHKNLTIGHLTASLPRNTDLLNNVLKFHENCAFCSRLPDKIQQTEPKNVCSGKN